VPFPALLSTLVRRRFQVKLATLLVPIDLFLWWNQSESYFLFTEKSGFSLPADYSFFLFSMVHGTPRLWWRILAVFGTNVALFSLI
jgi:hypothetical protein